MKKRFYLILFMMIFILIEEASAFCCGDPATGQCKCFGTGYCCDVNTGVDCAIPPGDCNICHWSPDACTPPITTTTTTTSTTTTIPETTTTTTIPPSCSEECTVYRSYDYGVCRILICSGGELNIGQDGCANWWNRCCCGYTTTTTTTTTTTIPSPVTTTQPPSCYDFKFWAEPEYAMFTLGVPTRVNVYLENTGDCQDDYNISYEIGGDNPELIKISMPEPHYNNNSETTEIKDVDPHETRMIQPRISVLMFETWEVNFTATSQSIPTLQKNVTLTVLEGLPVSLPEFDFVGILAIMLVGVVYFSKR